MLSLAADFSHQKKSWQFYRNPENVTTIPAPAQPQDIPWRDAELQKPWKSPSSCSRRNYPFSRGFSAWQEQFPFLFKFLLAWSWADRENITPGDGTQKWYLKRCFGAQIAASPQDKKGNQGTGMGSRISLCTDPTGRVQLRLPPPLCLQHLPPFPQKREEKRMKSSYFIKTSFLKAQLKEPE